MKHRVSDLEGALLDAAVAKADGWDYMRPPAELQGFAPSRSWVGGGPIIERERISVIFDSGWQAGFDADVINMDYGLDMKHAQGGPTPLIAAMRAYVASKLGNEVEL